MIIGEKIIALRKSLNWSQEELAEKLNVSRQSISKWESSSSIPDISRVMQISKLFEVSTDYLLNEEMESVQYIDVEDSNNIKISAEMANGFIKAREEFSGKLSIGVSLCILAPAFLILAVGLDIEDKTKLFLGLTLLFITVAVAVVLFITSSLKLNEDYNMFSDDEVYNNNFELEYGVKGIVTDSKKKNSSKLNNILIYGIITCILSVLPLLYIMFFADGLITQAVAIMLTIVSVGVNLIVYSVTRKGTYDILLSEKEYSKSGKEANSLINKIAPIYWISVAAFFLLVSFMLNGWGWSWIIFPSAAGIFVVIAVVIEVMKK